ncbi:MAG: histidine kinase, partial [Bacteroidota bacterium]
MKNIILLILLVLSANCFGQEGRSRLDSINSIILKLKSKPRSFQTDTLIVFYLNEIVDEEISLNGTEKGIKIAEEAITLSEEINWRKGIANSMFRKVEAIQVKSQYFSAIKESLKIINLFKKEEFPAIYMKCIRQIAACYMWMERPKEALKYYNLLFKENVPNYLSTSAYNDSFTEFGALYTRYLDNPKKGMEYFTIAKKAYEAKKDTFGLAYLKSYMGFAYEKLGNRKMAEESFDFAIKYYKKLGVNYILPDALNYASEYYYRKGDNKKSESLAEEAFQLADKLKILFSQRDANKNLYLVKKASKNYEAALKHYELFADSRDSMSEANIDDRLKVVRYEYDTQLQKAEIDKKTQENERKNNLIISLIIGIIGLGVIAFFAYRYVNIRKIIAEKEVLQLQQEKQLIGSNSVLKGQEEERSRLAKDLHDGLGGLLSGIKFTLNSMTGNQVISEQNSNVFNRALGQLDNAISELRRVA